MKDCPKCKEVSKLVDEQAHDLQIWFPFQNHPDPEYIRVALRKLHEVIEGKTSMECAVDLLFSGDV